MLNAHHEMAKELKLCKPTVEDLATLQLGISSTND
jgi:hypothetical protein